MTMVAYLDIRYQIYTSHCYENQAYPAANGTIHFFFATSIHLFSGDIGLSIVSTDASSNREDNFQKKGESLRCSIGLGEIHSPLSSFLNGRRLVHRLLREGNDGLIATET